MGGRRPGRGTGRRHRLHAANPQHAVEGIARHRMAAAMRRGRGRLGGLVGGVLAPRGGHPVEQRGKGASDAGKHGIEQARQAPAAAARRCRRGLGRRATREQRPLRSADDDDSRPRPVVAADRSSARSELNKRWRRLLHRLLLPVAPAKAGDSPKASDAASSGAVSRRRKRLPAGPARGRPKGSSADAGPPVPRPGQAALAMSGEAGLRQDAAGDGTFCSGYVLPNRTRSRQSLDKARPAAFRRASQVWREGSAWS